MNFLRQIERGIPMKRISSRIIGLTFAAILSLSVVTAQKKVLTHDVYDSWKSLGGTQLSNNGKWLAYSINPQEGDSVTEIKSTDGSKVYKIDRATNVRITEDSKFLIATIIPTRAETLKATRDKVKPEDRPKNSLVILNLASGEQTVLERVTSYSLAPKGSNWIIYRPEPPKPEPAKADLPKPPTDSVMDRASEDLVIASPSQAKQEEPKKEDPKKKKGHGDGATIVIRNLATGEETKMENVGTSDTDEKGTKLFYNSTPKGVDGHGVFVYDFASKNKRAIIEGLAQYTRISLSDGEKRIAILTDKDDYANEKPSFSIYIAETSGGAAKRIAHEGDKGVPKGWYVPSSSTLRWSKAGDRLLFTTVEKPSDEKKEEVPEDEKVSLDIWSWQDVELQPQQLLRANAARNKTYDALYTLSTNSIVQIETPEVDSVSLPRELNGNWGIWTKALSSGAGTTPDDNYLVDLRTGATKLLYKNFYGSLFFSPTGRWIVGFDSKTKESFLIDPNTGARTNMNDRFPYPIYDTKDDHPFGGGPYGTAGWNKDDSVIYVYDEFDIWALDVTKPGKAVCVTNNFGRSWSTTVRYVSVDPEAEFIDASKPSYVALFDTKTKDSGYGITTFNQKSSPTKLIFKDKLISALSKAQDADVFMYRQQDVNEYSDVYITNAKLESGKQFSDVNPQTSEYVWPTVELVSWTSLDGDKLQGKLYRPDNFDYGKDYPMITYFYEVESDSLHQYQTPAPSASTINIAWFVSNGYVVFVPDITYKVGYPGESAVSAIVSGVNKVVDMGFVDPKRLGIQGQSWGGYQVAYLVTETNMFAAAGAGAAVSNMFSAYGGIRYGSGAARQLQYEQGQSRIGGTMWEYPLRYLENSPIFFADKVQTPLLMMNNDADGAVPWTQGVEFFTALWRLQKPCWLLVYNGEDHNLMQRKNRKDLSIRLGQFFDHYLKDAPMPVWMSEGLPASKKGTTMGTEIPAKKGGGAPGEPAPANLP